MSLGPSAHVDTFSRDNLPPVEQWPDLVVKGFEYPERIMVRSINEIGHVMGMQTIAEFVENRDILDVLREIGVDYAQGYEIGRPLPITEFALL